MDYEKEYKEALERAKIWKDKSGMPKDKQGILDDIFPELKESGDERIRKELIAYFEQFDNGELHGVDISDWIAWLEKQGEKSADKMIEALRTEYEKGRADAITEMQGGQKPLVIDEGKAEMDYCFTKMMNGEKVSSAWSKNDEEMWIDAIKYLELFDAQGIHGDVAVPCMEWLKSLKDRVQPKQEWSEDDKGNMLSVKCVIDKAWHNQDFREDTGYSAEELESLWNWFDNIWQKVKYPQNPWKPSEEQMKWFSDIIDYHQFSTKGQKIMQSLYNDLKKLKESKLWKHQRRYG